MLEKDKELLQWDNWLEEAVRKIRTQKQRPGLDRIYNAVRLLIEKDQQAQAQGSPIRPIYTPPETITIEQVQKHLYRALKEGILLRILTKGQWSYRTTTEKSDRQINFNSTPSYIEVRNLIIKVLKELSEVDRSGNKRDIEKVATGFTTKMIQEYLSHSHVIVYPIDCTEEDAKEEFMTKIVEKGLEKEERKGTVFRNGQHYKLGSSGSHSSLSVGPSTPAIVRSPPATLTTSVSAVSPQGRKDGRVMRASSTSPSPNKEIDKNTYFIEYQKPTPSIRMSESVTCPESESTQVSMSHNDTPCIVDDMIDIKYDIGGNGSNSHTEETSSNFHTEQKQSDDFDFDFLQCERNCETCQKYIRILSEHVRTAHRGHPVRDPLHIEMPYSSSSQEIKCEVEDVESMDGEAETEIMFHLDEIKCEVEDVESMDCEVEAEIMFHTEETNESDNVPDYNVTDVRKVSIGEKPYPCEICGKGYSSKQKLGAHVKAIHGSDNQMNQTGDKPYKCEQCGRGYTTKSYLNIHKKIHTGEGLLDCDECDKTFLTKPHLTTHKKSHTGEKPYHCDECEKSFTKQTKLTIHKRSHTGERPFKCDEWSVRNVLQDRIG